MNFPRTFSFVVFVGALSLLVLPVMPGHGQTTATTGPVGYLQVNCLASSDTLVAIPFARPTVFTGAVASVTAGNVISFATAPGFTAGQFVFNPGGSPAVTDHFYLAVGPAPLSMPGTVSVTQGSPTMTGTGTTFTSLVAGDRMSINDGYNVQTYTVTAVASDTVLTVDRAYEDSAASASASNSTASSVTSSRTASTVSTATALSAGSVASTTPTTTVSPTSTAPTTASVASTTPTIAITTEPTATIDTTPTTTVDTSPPTTISPRSITPATASVASVASTTSTTATSPSSTTPTTTATTVAKAVVGHRPVRHRPEAPTAPTTVAFKSRAHTMAVEPARRLAAATKDVATAATTATLSGLTATYDHSPYEGRWYMVTANDASTVTVNLNGDTLPASLASTATQVSIVPCWTFDTLFPAANANVSFTPSTGPRLLTTQILLPDYVTADINLSSTAQYYYLSGSDPTNVGWRLYGDDPTINHGTDYLIPDGFFTVRNDNGAPTLPITFNGSVLVNKMATTLNANASQPQDNAVGLDRPVAATLNALGLNPADNSFQASSSPRFLIDQLLVFDNTQVAINKSSTAQYYYISTGSNVGWRLYGDDPTIDHGTDSIPAASALIVRKGTIAPNTATPVWTNAPNY